MRIKNKALYFLYYPLLILIGNNTLSASCPTPRNVRIIESSNYDCQITWKNETNAEYYQVKWRIANEEYAETNISDSLTENIYTIDELQPNTKYFFKLRSICSNNSKSKWSNEYTFITDCSNPSYCNMKFPLKDFYNSPAETKFFIQVVEFPDKKLGVDVFIQSVKLVVEHSWTNDLEIKLKSPTGQEVVLTSSNGLNDNIGYGNPEDTNCLEAVIFSDEACNSITENLFPFVGNYRPQEPLENLYDKTTPFGQWELIIIDKSPASTGYFNFIEIDFEPIICPVPKDINLIPQDDNSILCNWKSADIVDSVIIQVESELNQLEEFTIKNTGTYLISGLNKERNYKYSFISKCNESLSPISCVQESNFLCGTPSLRESFDNYETCHSSCDDCLYSEVWKNMSNAQFWLVNKGETTTEFTGPSSDLYGYGNYIYVESSAGECNDNLAILESECLQIGTNAGNCDMTFSYHMYGTDIGVLKLEISIDNGDTWTTLFKNSEQANEWITKSISLGEYANKVCHFRFVAQTVEDGDYGDIAIDDIIFYNAQLVDPTANLYYPDRDGDGFGKDTIGIFLCGNTNSIFVDNKGDCDDNNNLINPNAEEITCNFIDENCNGMEDDISTSNSIVTNIIEVTNTTCNGSSDGSITIEVSAGQPPYKFLWSNSSTEQNLTDVPSGYYQCEITDQSGCGIKTDSIHIETNEYLNFEILSIIEPECNGLPNGEIQIKHEGGVAPFQYKWSNGENTKNLSELNEGIYQVTITDSVECIFISPEIELKASTKFDVVVLNKVNPSCSNSSNGSINLRVNGGTPPYSFDWNNDMTTNHITNLELGEYYCTITDSDLCFQVFGPIKLTPPDSLDVIISAIDHVTCAGEQNGSVEIAVKGGTPPYSYLWTSKNFISSSDDIYNLNPGIYTLQVNDYNGCQNILDSIEITTIDALNAEVDTIIPVTCAKTNDGLIKIKANNGYGNYSYFWSNDYTISQNNYIDSLNLGYYGVTVTDELGCKQVLNNIEVNNLNTPIEINMSILDSILCNGDNSGSLLATIKSDNPPYDYNWSAGSKLIKNDTFCKISNLKSGRYNITVTDELGCVGIGDDVLIPEPDKLEFTGIDIQNIDCFGESTGQIDLEISGGITPYNILWSNERTEFSNTKLESGNYFATVSDKNNCTLITDTIFISQPDELSVEIESNPAHAGKADGSARILPQGGVSPYEFVWDENADNQTGNEAYNLASGWYDVTITDYNNCEKPIKVFIGEITGIDDKFSDNFTAYPNPTNNLLYIKTKNNISKDLNIELLDIIGRKTNIEIDKTNDKYSINTSIIKNGIYFLKIGIDNTNYIQRIVIMHD